MCKIINGTKQGGCLSHSLFRIYIHNLKLNLRNGNIGLSKDKHIWGCLVMLLFTLFITVIKSISFIHFTNYVGSGNLLSRGLSQTVK